MKRKGWFGNGLALLACLGILISGPALEAATAESGPSRLAAGPFTAAPDVALDAEGTLHGQVVDVQGNPLGKTAVAVRHRDREVARTVSDESGRFRLSGLRGGLHEIVVGQSATVCRAWAPNTAPPSARPAALVVLGDQHVLGQCGPQGCAPQSCCPQACNRLKCWLAHPLVICGIIAAAVAIPVAIHNCDDDDPRSP
jgi:hypothetical protein